MFDFIAIKNLVLDHPYLATTVLFAGTVLATEMIWGVIKSPIDLIRKIKPIHINEVVVFNELGEICSSFHYYNIRVESNGKEVDFPCYNPYCSIKCLGKLVQQIDQAVYAIDVAIYTFTSYEMCLAFKRALQRGVSIRIIMDGEMVFSSGSQINELAYLGIPVRGPDTSFLMHHKFAVIDGVERVQEIKRLRERKWMRDTCSVLISGSVNWTRTGFGGNWENCIITTDELLTRSFQAEFNRMWECFESRPLI